MFGVDDLAVLAVLAEADAAASLPRLGGMARPDGVAIVSERFWAFSRVGEPAASVRSMPSPRSPLARLPFVRGLVKLAMAIVPLLGRTAAARPRERDVVRQPPEHDRAAGERRALRETCARGQRNGGE